MKDFVITGWDNRGDEILFYGEDDNVACLIKIDDVISVHPGADTYKADHECDRAEYRHIPANELYMNGTDAGDPVQMAKDVWDAVPKLWIDENDLPINPKIRSISEHGFTIGRVGENIVEAWLDGIGSTNVCGSKLPQVLSMRNIGNNSIRVIFRI